MRDVHSSNNVELIKAVDSVVKKELYALMIQNLNESHQEAELGVAIKMMRRNAGYFMDGLIKRIESYNPVPKKCKDPILCVEEKPWVFFPFFAENEKNALKLLMLEECLDEDGNQEVIKFKGNYGIRVFFDSKNEWDAESDSADVIEKFNIQVFKNEMLLQSTLAEYWSMSFAVFWRDKDFFNDFKIARLALNKMF